MSPEQAHAMRVLTAMYGNPDTVKLAEFMHWPLLWLHWDEGSFPDHAGQDVHIAPNGVLLNWKQVPIS